MGLRQFFLLREDVVFLNHGSFGACPRPVFEVYQAWQRELEAQPVEFLGRRYSTLMREARTALAAEVGAQPDDLVAVTNTTEGINVIARALPLRPGVEVLITDNEYGAVERTWRFNCRKRGATLTTVAIPSPIASEAEFIDAVWSRVTDRTRVLAISHVTSPTGLIFPIAELVRRARAARILTVIDGAHAPGFIPLDLDALGADFYVGNAHKWLMAPKGAAFLHARKEAQGLLEPFVVSWGWEPERPSASQFIDEHEYRGSRDISPFLSIPAAIQFARDHGWDDVRARCRELALRARRRLAELWPAPVLAPDSWIGQMAAHPLPAGIDGPALQKRLYDEFRIEVPVPRQGGRSLLRVSVQGYNRQEDIDALFDALAAIG